MYTIESIDSISAQIRGRRLKIKAFKFSDDMHKFLNTADNALRWKESTKGLKPGVYAYAGQAWHNVKNLDPSILAHI